VTPEHVQRTLTELRADTLRRAADVADLFAASHHAQDPAAANHLILESDGHRVHVEVTEDANGNRRFEPIKRPDLPVAPKEEATPEERRGLMKRAWRRMMKGFQPHTPKYMSGSGVDGKGQAALIHFVGDVIHMDYHEIEEAGVFRVLKESATLLKVREQIPLLQRTTSRVKDLAAAIHPMRTRDGGEYQPWRTEVDHRFTPEEMASHQESIDLYHLNHPDHAVETPAPPHDPDGEAPPQERRMAGDVPQPVADAAAARDAALADVVRLAARHGIDLIAEDPKSVRAALSDATYELMRRAGAIEALREVSQRYHELAELVPVRPVSFTDKDPLGRLVRELWQVNEEKHQEQKAARRRERIGAPDDIAAKAYQPRKPRLTALDRDSVGNGGEWQRHYDEPDPEVSVGEQDKFFQAALRRDQIREERSNWAQLLGVGLDDLTPTADNPNKLRHTIADLRMQVRDDRANLTEFAAAVEHFQRVDAENRRLSTELADRSAHAWLEAHGGTMLEDGVGIRPGEHPGDPNRLVVIRGDVDHDVRLAEALAAHPDLATLLNHGELQLEYRVVHLDDGYVGIREAEAPQVRFQDVEVNGERTPVLMARGSGEPWRVVHLDAASPHETGGGHTPEEHGSGETPPRDPDVVREERNAAARKLSTYTMDLGENLEETIKALHQANMLRAAQVEGMADFIRSSDAIDTFHDLDRRLSYLANSIGVDPEHLTPERVAAAMTDPNVRKAARAQRIEDLLDYAKALRDNGKHNGTAEKVLAARDRLARRLGVDPAELYGSKHVIPEYGPDRGEVVGYEPDAKSTSSKAVVAAINDVLKRSGRQPELLGALAEYANTLAGLDPYRSGMRFDPSTDPRAADGVLPIHDPKAPAALEHLLSESLGEPPISDDLSHSSEAWSHLLGVDVHDIDAQVKLYRDEVRGVEGLRDRLTADQLARVLHGLEGPGDPRRLYGEYAMSVPHEHEPLSAHELGQVIDYVRHARYAEVFEVYRDGKIDKHERPKPQVLEQHIQDMRAEIAARDADIKALHRLAKEHDDLTRNAQPETPRTPRDVAAELAEARQRLLSAADAREHAKGRMWLQDNRPLADGDLTPGNLRGTVEYLQTRTAAEGGHLADYETRIEDLRRTAHEFNQAQQRVTDLESALHAAVEHTTGVGEGPVEAWQREVESARTDLATSVDTTPGPWHSGDLDQVVRQVEWMTKAARESGAPWPAELEPVRDAVHRYQEAREHLVDAELHAAEEDRAAETPRQRAERELASAQADLARAE
ncbi:hypothetical protein, partial [Nocardia sp. NPDC004722]